MAVNYLILFICVRKHRFRVLPNSLCIVIFRKPLSSDKLRNFPFIYQEMT